jgi:hypothetical protein
MHVSVHSRIYVLPVLMIIRRTPEAKVGDLLTAYLREYAKLNELQLEAKARFARLVLLHITGSGAALIWFVDWRTGTQPSAPVDVLVSAAGVALVLNATLLVGAGYQIYSFFVSALDLSAIRMRIWQILGEDVLHSERDLGRFPHFGNRLAKGSEAFPIIMWCSWPILIAGIGYSLPFWIGWRLITIPTLLYCLGAAFSTMAILYLMGLLSWLRTVSRQPTSVYTPPSDFLSH